jgi:hypothetical protein
LVFLLVQQAQGIASKEAGGKDSNVPRDIEKEIFAEKVKGSVSQKTTSEDVTPFLSREMADEISRFWDEEAIRRSWSRYRVDLLHDRIPAEVLNERMNKNDAAWVPPSYDSENPQVLDQDISFEIIEKDESESEDEAVSRMAIDEDFSFQITDKGESKSEEEGGARTAIDEDFSFQIIDKGESKSQEAGFRIAVDEVHDVM